MMLETTDLFPNNSYQLTITLKNPDEWHIRRMRDTDIGIVREIDYITWRDGSWSTGDFLKALDDPFSNCWILESTTNNQILGYGLQCIKGNISHIANLCLHPDHRGRGLGGILLRYLINFSYQLGFSVVQLEVNTKNNRALQLYTNHGFRIIDILKEYYSKRQDAYLMQLIIRL